MKLLTHGILVSSISWTNEEEVDLASWIARHDYERGEYAGARTLQEQVLEARARLLGKEHPDTLTAINNLAQTLKALRKRRWWQFWRTP